MRISEKDVEAALVAREELCIENDEDRDEEEGFAEALQYYGDGEGVNLPGVGTAYLVEYNHVNEDLELIFKIDEQFFRITGYYSSYDSDQWDNDVEEVAPEEKVIIVYKRITKDS